MHLADTVETMYCLTAATACALTSGPTETDVMAHRESGRVA